MTSLVWFRDDLRLDDHPALTAAARDPDGFIALYLFDTETPETRAPGAAAQWWLHHSLTRLREALQARGIPLVLTTGAAERVIPALVAEHRITHVFWNRRYGAERRSDARLKQQLRNNGVTAQSFQGSLLFEPGSITTGDGGSYRVYSAFWRSCLRAPAPAAPLPAPEHWRAAASQPVSDALEEWQLTPSRPDWAREFGERWQPGEAGAARTLTRFLAERAPGYERGRDIPAQPHTSELSPHLRWGEMSPRTIWHRSIAASGEHGTPVGGFLGELGWREFAWHTLFANPDLHVRGLNPRFDAFPWRDAAAAPAAAQFAAWKQGETGIAIVDAGMRELWRTGFMHNRVRMIVASLLTKNLLIDWRLGEAWFWDTLVDADAASNPFNWQWVAGCGADAAPYFRVFNPVLQQQRFDPEGEYCAVWAPDSVMTPPIVDLRTSRAAALEAYQQVRNAAP